ncbi:MAG: hypothetical protein PHT94_00765 [Candidatus Nanoarchaeia archaeon]|nr:hypothetical protein [Candidatus Nanoarchaeia archaeon]
MRIFGYLDILRLEPKTNKKISILKSIQKNEILKNILWWTYNPNHNFYITNIENFSGIGSKTIEDEGDDIFKLLHNLSKRKITGNTARNVIDGILSSYTKETQDVFKMILKRDLKCNLGASLINRVYGKEFIPEFKVQLANKYDSERNYNTEYFYATPKMDGLRCFWTLNTPNILWSRSGKEFTGFDKILKSIHKIIDAEHDITFFDGELFTKDQNFVSIQSSIMSNVNYDIGDKNKISYNIFALGINDTIIPTEEMQKRIEQLDRTYSFNNIQFIKAIKINNNLEDIENLTKEYVEQGYEGCMLRNPDISYDFKRSNNLLKVKFFNEIDMKVKSINEGQGKYENMMGSISCILEDNDNISVDVGTGFSDELREFIWENKDKLIGTSIELKYQDISQDKNGNKSLRFPVFSKFKV